MDSRNDNGSFRYAYSAKEQEELKKIRQKYAPHEEDKMEYLRRLDESATKPGMLAALSVGIISVLMFIPGIIIGIVGIAGAASAYPLYSHITKKYLSA